MKWILILVLFPALALASEECATQLGGKCRTVCAPNEKSEQGAFLDCTEKEKCCVPNQAQKASATSSPMVLIDQMAFSPEVMKVKAGTEVVWRNNDSSIHTVTADDGSFSSPPMDQGGVFKKIFTKPGTYSYACEMHPFMTGKIVVE
jgi:plastocyanin